MAVFHTLLCLFFSRVALWMCVPAHSRSIVFSLSFLLLSLLSFFPRSCRPSERPPTVNGPQLVSHGSEKRAIKHMCSHTMGGLRSLLHPILSSHIEHYHLEIAHVIYFVRHTLLFFQHTRRSSLTPSAASALITKKGASKQVKKTSAFFSISIIMMAKNDSVDICVYLQPQYFLQSL